MLANIIVKIIPYSTANNTASITANIIIVNIKLHTTAKITASIIANIVVQVISISRSRTSMNSGLLVTNKNYTQNYTVISIQ